MSRALPISLAVVVLTAGGCSDSTQPSEVPSSRAVGDQGSVAAKSASLTPMALRVSIATSGTGSVQCRICDDGRGDYINGSQNVSAQFDSYGNFIFDTKAVLGKAAVRSVLFDLTDPVSTTLATPPTQDLSQSTHFATRKGQFNPDPYVPIQTMAVNTSECATLGTGVATGGKTGYLVSFHYIQEDAPDSPTSYVKITRTTSTTWTMAPDPVCNDPVANVAALWSGDGSTLVGYYNLPFFFTLTSN